MVTTTTIIDLFRSITPPALWRFGQWAWKRKHSESSGEFEYIGEGWSYAEHHPAVRGWNVDEISAVYRRKWPKYVSMLKGPSPLGFSHESKLTGNSNLPAHNLAMSFAYVVSLTARQKDGISLLDWGGGTGHYYLLAKSLFPDITIEYHCKDLPKLAALGRELLAGQRFYDDDTCLNRKYDLVVASGSLYCCREWRVLLKNLAGATQSYLYIARLPVVRSADSFVYLQRPYKYGYNTEYLAWCLNENEFLKCAEESGLTLIREFEHGENLLIDGAPEKNISRGYLFSPRA